jgi:sporulation protein YhbH
MVERIERDAARFRDIVKGKIRQNLRKFITNTELIGRQGRTIVSIPVPQVELPHFTYRLRDTGGVGQGEGEEGDILWLEGEEGEGQRGAGFLPGLHPVEVEVSLDELVELLGEALELPRLQPKSFGQLQSPKPHYKSIRRVGPESLRHFKRTYREALKRQILSGTYDPNDPKVVPIREDRRYRSFELVPQPESKAVIFFMMDVSGSMGDEQKEIVRITAFWIDQWIRRHYQGIERRYIVHDAAAREVPEDLFYRLRESGGTKISSAYKLCAKLIEERYPPSEWNIYAFHFSDGDNWEEDDEDAFEVLAEKLLPQVNLFGYGQVYSHWGTGRFLYDLADEFESEFDNLRLTDIRSKDDILDAIRNLLGKRPEQPRLIQRPRRRS